MIIHPRETETSAALKGILYAIPLAGALWFAAGAVLLLIS